MQLPIDVKAVINEAVDIESARQTPISVSVLIDETAPADIMAHVRNAFASAATHARVTVGYLGGSAFVPNSEDDMAVLVAGLDRNMGAYAAQIRQAGVPTLVTTTMAEQVALLAEESGYPIPEGDLVAPDLSEEGKSQAAEAFDRFFGKIAAPDAIEVSATDTLTLEAPAEEEQQLSVEPAPERQGAGGLLNVFRQRAKNVDLSRFLKKTEEAQRVQVSLPDLLDEQHVRAFDNRMGEWIIAACSSKRLSFALAFPFVARPLSLEAVNATSVQNAGIGAVVLLPGADMPIMTLNQAKMLLQIAAAYGQPMTIDRVKELIALVGGAFACRAAARNIAGLVPGLGWAVKGAIGYSGTLAMGRAAIEYFENGGGIGGLTGTVLGVKNAATKALTAAGAAAGGQESAEDAQDKNQQAFKAAKELLGAGKNFAGSAATVAGPLVKSLAKGAKDSFAAGLKSMMK